MARAVNKLTVRTVQTAGAGRFGDGDGLYLIVDPSGARRWIFLFRCTGKQRAMGLGDCSPTGSTRLMRDQAMGPLQPRPRLSAPSRINSCRDRTSSGTSGSRRTPYPAGLA
ncbi:Arm DNA-binding domain-containing protein [Methylobacterium sp. SI9]|uniref:Arm DNA-binding domain-containing protein n=1 Tax=Methylobacterium guangdongense TaxID=3138811 RepID=UPI00313E4615